MTQFTIVPVAKGPYLVQNRLTAVFKNESLRKRHFGKRVELLSGFGPETGLKEKKILVRYILELLCKSSAVLL